MSIIVCGPKNGSETPDRKQRHPNNNQKASEFIYLLNNN